jgi:hypothetical protein
MRLRSATRILVVLALALPIIHAVLVWIRILLASMGDEVGAAIIGHVAWGCLVVWSIGLVGLVVVLGLSAVNNHSPEQ